MHVNINKIWTRRSQHSQQCHNPRRQCLLPFAVKSSMHRKTASL